MFTAKNICIVLTLAVIVAVGYPLARLDWGMRRDYANGRLVAAETRIAMLEISSCKMASEQPDAGELQRKLDRLNVDILNLKHRIEMLEKTRAERDVVASLREDLVDVYSRTGKLEDAMRK